MKLKITIDIFSGRPNPELIVSGAEAKKVLDTISPSGKLKTVTARSIQPPSGLGYRGIIVEQLDKGSQAHPSRMQITPDTLFGGGNYSSLKGEAVESFIFDKLRRFKNVPNRNEFKKYIEVEIKRFKINWEAIAKIPFPKWPPIFFRPCQCAPDPDLAWWNDGGTIQFNNNCYNYASNYRTNTFAQPGRASGQQYTSLSGCSVAAGQRSAKDGAIADQLINLPSANNKCPKKGHLVALVIAPGWDFHWFRKGPNGRWSHKPGGTQARITDNSNNLITDPRTANRGPYTQFCTFMQVMHGHIKIG
ncbi:MAG: hypothetical protein H7Y01_03060 [Ferruginibacter sp.]|nr:hypothetical protein [Chitinophagaceae bacterium]